MVAGAPGVLMASGVVSSSWKVADSETLNSGKPDAETNASKSTAITVPAVTLADGMMMIPATCALTGNANATPAVCTGFQRMPTRRAGWTAHTRLRISAAIFSR